MKSKDVKRMGDYIAKVSGKLVEVRIDAEHHAGGWIAENLQTGKQVRIKSARRLRGPAKLEATVATREAAPDPEPQKKRGRKANGKMSGLSAAAKLLAETGRPMSAKELCNAAIERGLWAPRGKTPERTLYAALITEIKKKGDDSRFSRADERGKFKIAI